ncbi:MAG: ABC transporter substrate-binding protein [Clostridia bacterium]|nr:ABC transporter substrate-binding protein [Clostridia bacterium]
MFTGGSALSKALRSILLIVLAAVMLCTSGCKLSGEDEFSLSIPKDFPANVGGVMIQSCPYNAVSLSPAITGVIYSLGSNSQLVGVSDLCDYPDIPSEMPRVGTVSDPDVVRIIELKCDLLFTETPLPDEIMQRLDVANVTVAVIKAPDQYSKASQFYRDVAVAMSGMHTGKQNAENTFNRIDASLKALKDAYDTSKSPRAVVVLAYDEAVATGDKAVGQMFEFTAANNVAKDAENYSFSTQMIANADPQFIFCRQSDREKILSDVLLKNTAAVKNGKVIAVDIGQVQRMSDYAVNILKEMCQQMYN